MKILVALSFLLTVVSAEVFSRCQIVHAIKNSKLIDFTQYSVADWVCMASHESSYNTLAVNYQRGSDGKIWSADYGIFQINSKWWCVDTMFPFGANGCHVNCNSFLTNNADLQPSIDCAAIIVQQQGMEAWTSWVNNCKGKWIAYYSWCV
ncbi:lysozyme C-1/C-2-like [Narcine bancroftii]|uniref:lysozyme C-1/C-2-like n=1 Tax=Narcine bancroftii TaxID=1343680 RepID=UPI003831C129